MRKPDNELSVCMRRRASLKSALNGSAMIIPANIEHTRNHDVHFPFRQSSNFYYLTGFDEPDAIFVFRPGATPETVLFVRPKDIEAETWDGFRFGPEAAEEVFGIDKAYNLDQWSTQSVELLKDFSSLYYEYGVNTGLDQTLIPTLEAVKKSHGRKGVGIMPVLDAREILGEARVIKSNLEIQEMKRAASISCEAHRQMMIACKPGLSERHLLGVFYSTIYKQGARGQAYNPIIASGNNATTLHYNFNDQILRDGDMLLIDAGCEYNYYASDITRTFPINGKFSEPQARMYDLVLDVQKKTIEKCHEGMEFQDLRDFSTKLLISAMLELGLLIGRPDEIFENGEFKKYYPHGIGHWLGLDVHDAGLYVSGKRSRKLQAGMVLTIEPGLYVPLNDTSAPKEYRGIGIRIEDNILVGEKTNTNFNADVPRERADIEALMS